MFGVQLICGLVLVLDAEPELELVCVWYRASAWNLFLERSSFLEQSGPCSGKVRVWLEERSCLQRSWLAEQNIVCCTECNSRDFIISELLLLVFFSS